jgi:murein DD-endopeptidase MepM/ murein hydrolase activator NlpD
MDQPDDAPRRRPGIALVALALLGAAVALGTAAWLSISAPSTVLRLSSPGPVPAAPEPGAPPANGMPAAATVTRAAPPPPPPARFESITVRLGRDQTIGQVLPRLGLSTAEATQAVAALQPLFPARRARPGDQLVVERRAGDRALHRLTYRQGRADEWTVARGPDGALAASRRPVALATEVARVAVTVEGSLYESLERSEEDPGLAVLAADVLAWDVDFYRDVRSGDRMKVLVEKVHADGRLLRYGEVLAVEYAGTVAGRKRLFRWTAPDGQTSYFDDDGQSARRGFLRTPLKYARVTSGYGNRRHPMLGFVQAHQGVDYGAPAGTPVWAVGDGVVRQAGWNGGCGRSVTIRHRNGLETLYCHLAAVAVAPGRTVSQKQVIGAVGSTGLSTGPHLHYAVLRGGAYMNPAQLKVPRDAPVKAAWKPVFAAAIAPLRARLDGERVAWGEPPPPPAPLPR